MKRLLLFMLLTAGLLIVLIKNAPKGNNYIQWEKEMIESGQMKIEKSEYFTEIDGVLKLK